MNGIHAAVFGQLDRQSFIMPGDVQQARMSGSLGATCDGLTARAERRVSDRLAALRRHLQRRLPSAVIDHLLLIRELAG